MVERKKIVADFIIIGIAFLLFTIWYGRYQNHKNDITVSNRVNSYTVYLITIDKQARFWEIMDEGARDMARLLGINYIWSAPAERDVEEQIALFREAVNQGADAIMLAASAPIRIAGAVEEAKAEGVKIIYVDAPAVEEAEVTLGTDNYNAGRIAGEAMLNQLGAVGISEGAIGIVGVTPESATTVNRENGFREVIANDGRFRLLSTVYSFGIPQLAEQAPLELINENEDLVGLFGTNEGTTIGVGNAIKNTNSNIIGVGFDFTGTIRQMISDEILDVVLVQNPYTMGYLGMAEAFAALQGNDTGPDFINTGVSIIDKYTPQSDIPVYE